MKLVKYVLFSYCQEIENNIVLMYIGIRSPLLSIYEISYFETFLLVEDTGSRNTN